MRTRLQAISVMTLLVAALALSPALMALELGNASFDNPPAKPLTISRDAGPRFLRLTGGIAFANEAEGRDGLQVSGLSYDADAPDGSRLVVTLSDADGAAQSVRGELYDWELVPVARYAGDTNDAAFTYFGELESKAREQKARAEGYRVLNYHPAFENTLVGLRLMQLDFLMIDGLQNDAMYLPKEDGKTLLGNGEADFLNIKGDVEAGVRRFEEQNFTRLVEFSTKSVPLTQNESYRSYVAGDFEYESPVFYVATNEQLAFSGGIYWYFWNDPEAAALEANIRYYNELVRFYNFFIEVEEDDNAAAAAADAGVTVEDLDQYRDYVIAAIDKSSTRVKAQAARLEEINADNDRAVNAMPELTETLNDYLREYRGLNPLILRAGDRVAWYSALFRHYAVREPDAYDTFVQSLENVAVRPAVETPTLVKTQ